MTRSTKQQQQGVHVLDMNQAIGTFKCQVPLPNPNKTIRLDGSNDYQFVSNSSYPFTLGIDTLINSSTKSRRHAKYLKKGIGKAPRPQNAWVIYRRDTSARLMNFPEFSGMKACVISKRIAIMWDKESKEVRDLFSALCRLAGQRHLEVYGEDYKYHPEKKSRDKKKNNDNNDNDNNDNNSTQSSPISSPSMELEFEDSDDADDDIDIITNPIENEQHQQFLNLEYYDLLYYDQLVLINEEQPSFLLTTENMVPSVPTNQPYQQTLDMEQYLTVECNNWDIFGDIYQI